MGARVVWDHEVAGSIPVTPTKRNMKIMFLFLFSIFNNHILELDVLAKNYMNYQRHNIY